MDRFIDLTAVSEARIVVHLKSNMDRFIGSYVCSYGSYVSNLKSNMDRFIASHFSFSAFLNEI